MGFGLRLGEHRRVKYIELLAEMKKLLREELYEVRIYHYYCGTRLKNKCALGRTASVKRHLAVSMYLSINIL